MTKWLKKGLIFSTSGTFEWSKTHAQMPLFYQTQNGNWRFYYSTRNNKGQSNFSFIETKAHQPEIINYIHNKPLLDFGNDRSFDSAGIMASSIVKDGDRVFLYYIGWSIPKDEYPYHVAVGLAVSDDDGVTFKKVSQLPILDKRENDPLFSSAPHVIKESNCWKMWYISCKKWLIINGREEPIYSIKYSESTDGINWPSSKEFAIEQDYELESVSNPCVIFEAGKYKMWYSSRSCENYRNDKNSSYKIGYAESFDGKKWIRKDDQTNISKSQTGWDSEMLCYSNVAIIQNQKYMFYNGNGFGQSGFGYAIAD